jgi:hypothetical protein
MVDSSKMVYGDQFQIRLDPGKLEAKTRKQWSQLYFEKEAEKARMFFSSSALALASGLSFVAGVQYSGMFLPLGIVLGGLALRSFYKFGYDKGILDDWGTKNMVRVDK